MGYQFGLGGPTHEQVADHLLRPQRWLAARVQADQQAGDDGAVRLNLDAAPAVAEQVPAAQHVLEKAEEQLDRVAIKINQGEDLRRYVQEVRGDAQQAVAGPSAGVALA